MNASAYGVVPQPLAISAINISDSITTNLCVRVKYVIDFFLDVGVWGSLS
jgi:hypothetical protein